MLQKIYSTKFSTPHKISQSLEGHKKNDCFDIKHAYLEKSKKFKDCNYLNSLIINSIYLTLIVPALFFDDNGLICKYWFFSLLVLYTVFYYLLYSFEKKQ